MNPWTDMSSPLSPHAVLGRRFDYSDERVAPWTI